MPVQSGTVGKTTDTRQPDVSALEARMTALEQREALRSAEHVAMVQQLDRIAKRMAARLTRDDEPKSGESVASLRSRLGR